MSIVQTPFVWFEFDKEVEMLWKDMGISGKRFAYHPRLSALIGQTPNFKADLDSLKVLDVFLSAIKSDLARKNVSEGRVLAHDEFARLVIVLLYHVVRVIEQELMTLPKTNTNIYTAQGFSRVYTRLFSQVGTSSGVQALTDAELDAFYYGMGVLCQGVNAQGQAVADRIFILPIMGARLFGSIDRSFMAGLDDDGKPVGTAEDSLYWAIHDFVINFKALQSGVGGHDGAKALFSEEALSLTKKTQMADKPSGKILTTDLHDELKVHEPVNMEVIRDDSIQPSYFSHASDLPNETVKAALTSPVLSSENGDKNQPNMSRQLKAVPPSVYKQKARASHTPKLFDEIYHDLSNISLSSDAVNDYQKAHTVLTKFDKFIETKLNEGKDPDEIVFNENQSQVRNQALTLLVGLVKQGNPSAMLRLALCYFGGRGVSRDTQKAIMLTKRAAQAGDIRAQKLLSRLYYQGFSPDDGGVAMDVGLGEYWLRKAAEGGHPEAKKVCAYMNQVEILKGDYQAEAISDKRYGMLFIALGVGTVLLFIVLSILF